MKPGAEPEDVVLPHDLEQRDELIVGWCAELAARDLWLGKMLSRFFAMRGVTSEYVSEGHYARERLGMSRSSAYARIKLARSTTALDRIAEAVQRGEIGFQAAAGAERRGVPGGHRERGGPAPRARSSE